MRQVKKDSTNVSVDVYIIDSTDGTPELGVLFNTAGMDLEYRREGAAVVNITEATLAALTTAHAEGGFLEIGHGLYRLDLPDAAVATGAETVSIQGTVTGMIVLPQTVQLVDFDPEDGVRLGLTALPNAAADAAGGLIISDLGGLDADAEAASVTAIETDTNEMQGKLPTNNFMGSSDGADDDGNIAAILVDTAEIGAAGAGLTDLGAMSTAMKAEVQTEVEAGLEDAGLVGVVTTIATLASQTSFTLTAGSADNDAYNGFLAIIEDAATAAQKAFGFVEDYVGVSKTITLTADPGIYTMAATDKIALVPMGAIVDQTWDEILTGATHNIASSAGRRLRGIQEFQGYEGGAIWIDTVNGTAGTTDFENGTVENPVDSIADANTLAASLGISRFVVISGSTITFAASQQNQIFDGAGWTLALGGQNIDGSVIAGATVSGIATNTAGVQFFLDCIMNATTVPGDTHVIRGGIAGTQTLGEAGDFFYEDCHSSMAGTSTPALDFGAALNASNVNFRHYSGGIEIQNMGAGTGSYTMSLEGDGQLVINANCSATSTVAIRGNFTVTDNAAGAVTLSDDARIDVTQINDEVKDVLETDTHAEPSAVPAATASLKDKINWQSALARNKITQTATTQTLRDDADGADIATATVSDDGTTATREEWS